MWISGGILVILALAALWGRLAPPYDPLAQDFSSRLQTPNSAHPLGTDHYGRDVLSRLLAGAAPTLLVSLLATSLACVLGVPYGVACASSGRAGQVASRLLDGVQAFPGLLLCLLLVAVAGPSYQTLVLAIGFSFASLLARVSEAVVDAESTREYAVAARAAGCSHTQLFSRHLLPNGVSALLVQATTVFALAVLSEATLSFLGLGPSLTAPTWGRMLYDARATMELAPHTALAPLATISLTVLAANIFGDGLRDALDPVVAAQRMT